MVDVLPPKKPLNGQGPEFLLGRNKKSKHMKSSCTGETSVTDFTESGSWPAIESAIVQPIEWATK